MKEDQRPSVLDALPRPQAGPHIDGDLKAAVETALRGQQFTEAGKDSAVARAAALELAETLGELRDLLQQATDTAHRVRELAAIVEGAPPVLRVRHGVTRAALPKSANLEDLAKWMAATKGA